MKLVRIDRKAWVNLDSVCGVHIDQYIAENESSLLGQPGYPHVVADITIALSPATQWHLYPESFEEARRVMSILGVDWTPIRKEKP